jgi:hypothetical protein
MGKPREKRYQARLPESGLFSESGVKFLVRCHVWIVAAGCLCVRGYLLWANLHGGYIFALVLGVMTTATTAFLVMVPSLVRG